MALDFNAANRKIVVPNSATLSGMTEFSKIIWVLPLDTPLKDDGIIYREDSGGALAIRLIVDNSGFMQYFVARDTDFGFKVNSSLPLTVGAVSCIGITFDTTDNLDMYIGGPNTDLASPTFSSDTDGAGALSDHDGLLTLGNSEDNQATRFFTGAQSVFKLYNKRLTLDEMIIEQYRHSNIANRVLAFDIGRNVSGSTQGDLSGNGNDGTITGAVDTAHAPIRPISGGGKIFIFPRPSVAPSGRIMGSLAGMGGLAGAGGLAGRSGGMAG